MYNLAIRKCTSPPLLARGPGSNPGPAEPEADMLPSEPARQAYSSYYIKFSVIEIRLQAGILWNYSKVYVTCILG